MRVPRSILLGRPWPAAGEPLWLEEDIAYALAWQAELDGRCRGCGQPLEESTDPAHTYDYEGHSYVCHGCAAKTAEARRFSDAAASDAMDGRYFYTAREEDSP